MHTALAGATAARPYRSRSVARHPIGRITILAAALLTMPVAHAQSTWRALVDETFGTGAPNVSTSPTVELNPGTTDYAPNTNTTVYNGTGGVADGQYSVTKNPTYSDDFGFGYSNQWQHGGDHTTGTGYMALFNANPARLGEANGTYYLYSTAVADIPGASYRLNYWAANILRSYAGGGYFDAYIGMTVRDGANGTGILYGSDPNGATALPRASNAGGPAFGITPPPDDSVPAVQNAIPWMNRSLQFQLPVNYAGSALYFNFYNSAPAFVTTSGNDLVVDDILIEMATATISGRIYLDNNQNGLYDAGDGLFSATLPYVAAIGNNGKVIDFVQIAADGTYALNLAAWSTADIGQKLVLLNSAPAPGQTINTASWPSGHTVISETPNATYGSTGVQPRDGILNVLRSDDPSGIHPNFNIGLIQYATLRVVKSVPTGQGAAFDFSQSGVPATATGSPNAATATNFQLNPSVASGSSLTATQSYSNIVPAGTIALNELNSADINQYDLVNIVCADAAGAPVGSLFSTNVDNAAPSGSPNGTATVTLVPGADVTCTFNNVRNPRIVIVKNTVGGDGTFNFTQTSSLAGTTINPAGPQVLTTATGSAVTNTSVSGLTGADTTTVTITEMPTEGFALTALSCTDLGSVGTQPTIATDPATGVATLSNVGTGDQVQCTYTNTKQGTITIVKDAVPNDAQDFAFTTSGTGLSGFSLDDDADATLSNARTFTGLAAGSYTVTEVAAAAGSGWNLTGLSCSDPSGGTTTSGATATIGLATGETVTCTYTNTRSLSDLSISKTNTPGSGPNDQAGDTLTRGATTTYTILVTNNGPDAVTGAILTDPPGSRIGLTCTAPPTCSGTACPAGLTLAQLGSGVALGTLANGASVTVTLTCVVN
ncbi:hypothetical protein ABU614_12610 [Lysobacter firmicutimachus]|uniref:DUF11 domain-containing protein n=1 Tax=Lysobacter firmicutimachus TaxID=1792846 RepID=A0AAU8MM44_9GAMM